MSLTLWFLCLLRIDEVKEGKLVGVDKFGNKYYENPMYFLGKNIFREYSFLVTQNCSGEYSRSQSLHGMGSFSFQFLAWFYACISSSQSDC